MLNVIKIGGNIIDDKQKLQSFINDFSKIDGPKILVHGGGKIATGIGQRLNIEPNYVDGRRITDAATLELVTMVYGGLINKNIVAAMQAAGCNAIGITGADADIISAVKRKAGITDYGYVGDVTAVNIGVLKSLLDVALVPVIAPLTHDGEGNMLNTNADTIAQEIAKSMSSVMKVNLIYCFEKNGVLNDIDDDTSVISEILVLDFDRLKANWVINGGMLPKIENACNAVRNGVAQVVIGNSAYLYEMINGEKGTVIK